MTPTEAAAEFNRIMGNLAHLRTQYMVYGEDWGSLPPAVRNAVKARVVSVTSQASVDLAALSAQIQLQ